jgi:hypothetical protein
MKAAYGAMPGSGISEIARLGGRGNHSIVSSEHHIVSP